MVSSFITLDPDKAHTHTYTLITNPSSQFAIVNNSLYTSAAATLNYEAQQEWVRCMRNLFLGVTNMTRQSYYLLVRISLAST